MNDRLTCVCKSRLAHPGWLLLLDHEFPEVAKQVFLFRSPSTPITGVIGDRQVADTEFLWTE